MRIISAWYFDSCLHLVYTYPHYIGFDITCKDCQSNWEQCLDRTLWSLNKGCIEIPKWKLWAATLVNNVFELSPHVRKRHHFHKRNPILRLYRRLIPIRGDVDTHWPPPIYVTLHPELFQWEETQIRSSRFLDTFSRFREKMAHSQTS